MTKKIVIFTILNDFSYILMPTRQRLLNITLIDPDPESLNILTMLLKELPIESQIKTFSDSELGYLSIHVNKPDLLILDLDMPILSGIEILEKIYKHKIHIHVIVCTSNERNLLSAARFGLIDFILKPIDKYTIKESIDKFFLHNSHHKKIENSNSINQNFNKIHIPTSFLDLYFLPDEICFIEADSNYSTIITLGGTKITSSYNIGRLHQKLPNEFFLRISRSIIINYIHLKRIDRRKKVFIICDNEIELSYSNSFVKKLSFPTFDY